MDRDFRSILFFRSKHPRRLGLNWISGQNTPLGFRSDLKMVSISGLYSGPFYFPVFL